MSTLVKYATAYDEVAHSGLDTSEWSNLNNILQNSTTMATGSYRDNKVPQQLYLYDFELGLTESNAVKSVTFEVKLSCSNGLQVNAPTAFVNYGRDFSHSNLNYNNTIRVENNNQISNYGNIYSYKVGSVELAAHNMGVSALNSDIFGLVLQFPSKQSSNGGYIYVEWVRVTVEYDEPYYVFGANAPFYSRQFDAFTYVDYGFINTNCNTPFYAKIEIQNMSWKLKGGSELKVDLPEGLHVKEVECTRCTWDDNTNTLNLLDEGKSGVCFAKFMFVGKTSGYKKVTFHGENIGSWTRWLYINKNPYVSAEADEQVTIATNTCRKGAESIITVAGKTYNTDGTAEFEVWLGNEAIQKIVANLDQCDAEVSVNKIDYSSGQIIFNVPSKKYVEFSFDVYFIPTATGTHNVTINTIDSKNEYSFDFNVEEPYNYKFDFNCKDTLVEGGRLVSTLETGAYVLPCRSVDNSVKVKKPTLNVKEFEDIDYIGCVKLKQTHYSPKSTFKDTLLNTNYKNKRYMGKKGSIDEDITLTVRLPPVDVTTVQGMVEMDKPIPININHLCFEGDSLNHRGWAEIYGIQTERVGNNSLWYDCDIDVKYITHNISSRFQINKGSRVSDYFLPNLLTSRFESGCDMGDAFYDETSGVIGYNGDNVDVNRRNVVVLDEGEYAKLRSQDVLDIKCKAVLNWASTVNTETRDNHVSRIFRLIDKTSNNTVFEYEYYDFTHDGEDHGCRVIGRLLYKNAYKVVINRRINLYNDTTEDNDGTPLFGSELQFELMSNILTIRDSGWSGKELLMEDITLENGEYYLELEVKNNNSDLDASPIVHYFNYSLMDLVINNEYNPYYQNILVSPFPVPGKDVLYTRDSEDGTIFYLEDDGTECSYNLSPYYQYHTGVSLESYEGIQLINLDNNHTSIYITNGLVKLGLNRLNGKVTLYKYDHVSGQYILVSHLQLTKYDDMNINNFTDDKIELQISDTIFTVWRGRPFVRVSHPTEDINFSDKFIRVYAEKVGDYSSEYPRNFELVDDSNLFPICVGSKRLLKSDCVGADTQEVSPSWTNLSLQLLNTNNQSVSKIGISQPCRFKVGSTTFDKVEEISFVVDGEMIPAKVYLDTAVYNEDELPTNYIDFVFDEIGTHRVQAVWTEVDGYDYALSSELTIDVFDDSYNLTALFGDELYYNQGSFDFLLTYAGSPAPAGKVVNITANGLDYPKATDSNGKVSLSNHLDVGDYVVSANFCKAIADTSVSNYDPSKITVIDAKASKNVQIKKAYSQVDVVNSSGTSITKASVKKGSYVNCKLYDTIGNALSNSVVTITVNGVSYTRVTDSNGYARLNINLLSNTYDLQVSFMGTYLYEPVVKNFELIVVD